MLNNSGTERYPIVYFHSPNPDRLIECLPSCTSPDNPPHYPPAVYRELVLGFYQANICTRKGDRLEAAAQAAVLPRGELEPMSGGSLATGLAMSPGGIGSGHDRRLRMGEELESKTDLIDPRRPPRTKLSGGGPRVRA